MPTKTITRDDGTAVEVDTDTGELLDPTDNPAPGLVPAEDGALVPIPAHLMAEYDGYLASVPEAGGDGLANILEQIAAAKDATEVDAPWRTDRMMRLRDVPLIVTGARRSPSDFEGGLAWFLIVDATVRASGERITFTTGAIAQVAQLAKLWALNALPAVLIPRRAERPNAKGFFAWHFEVVR